MNLRLFFRWLLRLPGTDYYECPHCGYRCPKNIYQLYHSTLRFDIKKLYRYLRYCMHLGLVEIDHVAETGFLPAKFYRLTQKGQEILAVIGD